MPTFSIFHDAIELERERERETERSKHAFGAGRIQLWTFIGITSFAFLAKSVGKVKPHSNAHIEMRKCWGQSSAKRIAAKE